MIKNCFVVDSTNLYYWFDDKQQALDFAIDGIKTCGQKKEDTFIRYSKCNIDDNDSNIFNELVLIENIELPIV